MSTLADDRERTNARQVKSKQGFFDKFRPQRTADTEPQPQRTRSRGEHAPGNTTPLPARTPRTDPDDIAANMIVKLGGVLRPGHGTSSTALLALLDADFIELHKRANRETELGRSLARRDERAVSAAGAAAAAIEAAVRLEVATGVPAHLDPEAIGVGIARLTANAHAPEQSTMQFPVLSADVLTGLDAQRGDVLPVIESVTVAGPVSPVHVPGDDLRPAVPDVGDAALDTGAHQPLPRRVPQASTHMVLPADLDVDPYEAVDPTVNGRTLASGVWVFDEGTGTGGPVWFLLGEQRNELREGGRVAVLRFANGFTREVDAGKQVKVLDARRAQVLVAQIEARLAQRDAEVSS